MEAKTEPKAASAGEPRPILLVGNAGEPIELTGVKLAGFSAENARAGEVVRVWTKLALTSDEPIFHRMVEGLSGSLAAHAQEAGRPINLTRASSVLLVIRPDETAHLRVDSAAVVMNALAKSAVKAGTPVFERDIADVTELRFPAVDIKPTDRLLYLFREDWRFALFFDFNPEGNLSLDEAARTLGALYRNLKYRHLYDALSNEVVFGRLVQAGWFPFADIIRQEFKSLALASEAGFALDDAETELCRKFDDERLERMFARWVAKPHFKPKEPILRSAIDAYKAKNWISVLKTVLTEIEGILQEAHRASTGSSAKIDRLLKFAVETAERKAGGSDTLLFTAAFAKYLESNTFAHFDPSANDVTAGSRHAVGHGAARAATYTQVRALQALLTLDQFAFYT
ncbi:MAG: hypothetical protein WD036_10090 [Bauldia sp.]